MLARSRRVEPDELRRALYVHRGEEVAHHLASVAGGLCSLVVGEAQIQGQVRSALGHSLSTSTAGPELRRLFESAIAAGRRIRSETAIGCGLASVPEASVEFARERLVTLSGSSVLLIGAGTTSELAAKQLVKRGVGEMRVLGRDQTRATRLAQRHGGRVITPDGLGHALTKADVVISSTGAPHPIVHRDRLERALAQRHVGRTPLLLIDLAVPRDIDPAVVELAGVEVHTLDDLNRVVERVLVQRRRITRRKPWCASRSRALRNGCGVVGICATATRATLTCFVGTRRMSAVHPRGRQHGAGSLQLRACGHLERDLPA